MSRERKSRIKIEDLPRNRKLSRSDLKNVLGGGTLGSTYFQNYLERQQGTYQILSNIMMTSQNTMTTITDNLK